MGRLFGAYGEKRGVYRVLVGKPEGTRPLGRPRHRWENNIRKNLQEVGLKVMDWIELAQDKDRWRALVNAEMNLGDSIKCGEFLD
jgi:late competence protein required for DNA uptake (superfamily II DNA/RNA helicase)